MSPLRYLLDENVDSLYASELIRRDPALVVWRVGAPGAPPKGTSDPHILKCLYKEWTADTGGG